ncbi:MAG: hypothetical protein U9P12_10440 [Verrucomicrobiota bacterium]|nr:hypothetical protein [Verrucomicrobiota bacterium]
MLKVILAKIGLSLFRYLPLEQIVAKLLTKAIRKLMGSSRTTKVIDRVRKTVTHLNELTALIEPMLDDQAVTGDEARAMYNDVNQTRLQILKTWSKGDSAKHLEAQLP